MTLSLADFGKALDDTTGALVPRPTVIATFPLLRTPDFLSDSNDPFERPCEGGALVPPQGGLFTELSLFNPPRSGVVARVRLFSGASAGSLDIRFTETITVGGNVEAANFRNAGVTGLPACGVFSNNLAARTGVLHFQIINPVDSAVWRYGDWILPPGNGINMYGSVVNLQISGIFQWEEIPQGQP